MLEETGRGLVLKVTVRPSASRDQVLGRHGDRLKLSVQAPPEKGRANQAVLLLLARLLGLKKAHLSLLRGDTSRDKDVLIEGLTAAEVARLLELEP